VEIQEETVDFASTASTALFQSLVDSTSTAKTPSFAATTASTLPVASPGAFVQFLDFLDLQKLRYKIFQVDFPIAAQVLVCSFVYLLLTVKKVQFDPTIATTSNLGY
jgi:hypothetical protein